MMGRTIPSRRGVEPRALSVDGLGGAGGGPAGPHAAGAAHEREQVLTVPAQEADHVP